MFYASGLIFSGSKGVGTRFMFCLPVLVFGGTEGVGSRFHILRSRTHFQRYRGRRFPFSCFALPDSFPVVPRVSGPIFMFCMLGLVSGGTDGAGSVFMSCPPELVFDGTEDVGSRFHVLRSGTHFRRCEGRRDPFSCFTLQDSFSAVSRASGPIFKFCAPYLVFDGNDGVSS
jgi:hypothetical protein